MKKTLGITISLAALLLASCGKSQKPNVREKDEEHHEEKSGRVHRGGSIYNSSGSHESKSGSISRGGFGHTGGTGGGGS